MTEFAYPPETAGEALYLFLRRWLRDGVSSGESFSWLSAIDHSIEWSEYIEQFVAVALTGQFVAAGRTFRERHGQVATFSTEMRSYIREVLTIDKVAANTLVRMTTSASDESMQLIPDGLARTLRTWAMANHPNCYLCGHLLEFADQESPKRYTADHIWPRSFGGHSFDGNLLPACHDCNSNHKQNFATWAMTSVQSVILGLEPSAEKLRKVAGASRFALHHRRVQEVAIKKQISLKHAYRLLGPSEPIRTKHRSEVSHFFNLENHSSEAFAE